MNFRSSPLSLLACLCFFLPFAPGTLATQISFTHSGKGSGHIGATFFTNASFSISEVADTVNRVPFSNSGFNGFTIQDTSASISISGVGIFNFTIPTLTFVNNSINLVGFSRASDGADLFNGPTDAAFSTWDMATAIGPITGGTGQLLQWTFLPPITTDGGVLVFTSESGIIATFQATLIPEPSSFVILLAAMTYIATRFRRSLRARA